MGARMSQLGELRTAAARARSEFDRAQNAAGYARTSRVNWATAVTQWQLSKPQEASVREPRPITEGWAHYDIAMPAPPSDEEVKRLERGAAKAERKLNKTRQALADEVAAGPPKRKPSTTGYAATKNFRFLGVAYNVGDEFDPGIAEPAKFARLIGSRMVAATSPAGADHAS